MGKINLGRVVIAGLAAGVIINLFEFLLNGVILDAQWTALMKSINRPVLDGLHVGYFMALGFVQGLIAVWTYAAIRPRFGLGPMTAITAALLTWLTTVVVADLVPTIMGVFELSMVLMMLGVGLIEIVIATLVGGYLYKE
jgi:hypothetical protein